MRVRQASSATGQTLLLAQRPVQGEPARGPLPRTEPSLRDGLRPPWTDHLPRHDLASVEPGQGAQNPGELAILLRLPSGRSLPCGPVSMHVELCEDAR